MFSPTRLSLLQRPNASIRSPNTYVWPAYTVRGSHNPRHHPPGFDNLLEGLTELRKILNYYQFIIKDTIQEQPNGRDAQSKERWGGRQVHSFHNLSGYTTFPTPQCVHQPWSSPNPMLVEPSLRGHWLLVMGLNLQLLSCVCVRERESSNTIIMAWFLDDQFPSWRDPGAPSQSSQKDTLSFQRCQEF